VRNRRAQIEVLHAAQDDGEFVRRLGRRARTRNRARRAPLRRAVDGREGSHVKAQLARVDPAIAKTDAELLAEKRQLVRPDARRNAEQENASVERYRQGALGDPRADRIPPHLGRDRGPDPGKAILSGAIEDRLERLGRAESVAAGVTAGTHAASSLP
jgi:hypothetical protein